MRFLRPLTAICLGLFTLSSAALAEAHVETFFSNQTGDFAPSTLVRLPAEKASAGLDRQPAHFAWPLAAEDTLSAPAPHVARSREYFVRVTGAELMRGIPVFTTAPSALLRINPERAAATASTLDAEAISITRSGGLALRGGAAMDQIANARQLEQAGAPFPTGTLAFRLRSELGAGRLTLTAAAGVDAEVRYVVHVFDRASTIEVELSTSRQAYLAGEPLSVRLGATNGREALALAETTAYALAPSGRSWPLSFQRASDGGYHAQLPLEASEGGWGGLWEVKVSTHGTDGGATFLRNASTAFAVTAPTARITNGLAAQLDKAGLALSVPVEVAAASRYAVRAVLFGTNDAGELKPLAAVESAAWLEAGSGTIALPFDRALLERSGLAAPYELRQVELFDQHRFGLLQRQERLARIEP